MLTQNEQLTVMNIISAVCRGSAVPFPMDGTDYAALYACASEHGFEGLLCAGLKEIYLPEQISAAWAKKSAAYSSYAEDLKKLLGVLNSAGCRSMVLDGAALSGLYGLPSYRGGRDINVLVDDEKREDIKYLLEKHGFQHIRECRNSDYYYVPGRTRFVLISEERVYNGRIRLWENAKPTGGGSAYAMSPAGRYMCALLKLSQRLSDGYGGVMQLMDAFLLIFACGDRLSGDAFEEKLLNLGLTEFDARIRKAYRAFFLSERDAESDYILLNDVFRQPPKNLPPRYVSPEKQLFYKRVKRGLAIAGGVGAIVACVTLILIFNNRFEHSEASLPSYSEEGKSDEPSGVYIGAAETAFGSYSGELKDGIPEGDGVMHYYNGDVYTGGFSEGVRNGSGETVFKTGGSYKGNYVNDKMQGSGKLVCENGDVITGEFSDNSPNGSCEAVYADGGKYKGGMVNGVRSGEGTFTYANGDVYTGDFASGFRNGKGKYTYAGGSVYDGDWVNGVQNGSGTFKSSDGTYTGGFAGGVFSGDGVFNYANGDIYEGKWSAGKPNGTGKFTSGGEVYEGGFLNGIIYGSGQKTFSNGDIVKGTFTDGKLNGEAQYYFKAYGYWRKVMYEDGKIVKYLDEN